MAQRAAVQTRRFRGRQQPALEDNAMRLAIIAFGLAALATTPAWATGTLACEASQPPFDFDIMATVPYDQGSPLLQLRGEVATIADDAAKTPLVIEFDDSDNTQYWLDETSLNLLFYREGEDASPFNETTLTIKTTVRADDPVYFDGTYQFESSLKPAKGGGDPFAIKSHGNVTCSFG
jgi:hypothetical protein